MRHNLKAVFKNRDDAQHVLNALLVFSPSYSKTTLVSPPESESLPRTDTGFSSTVRQMLARLFGPLKLAPELANESAFLPGRHVISVRGLTDLDSIQAIGIMDPFGPIYVEDMHEQAKPKPVDVALAK